MTQRYEGESETLMTNPAMTKRGMVPAQSRTFCVYAGSEQEALSKLRDFGVTAVRPVDLGASSKVVEDYRKAPGA